MNLTLSTACLSLAMLAIPPAAVAQSSAAVFQNGPAFIIESESLPSGHASAELGGGGTDGVGSFSYVASAYADTRHGSLGAATTATGVAYPFNNDRLTVHAQSELTEFVTFSTDGPVTFRLAVQGSFDSVFGGQMTSFASLTVPGFTNRARTFWRGGSTPLTLNVPAANVISDDPSNYIVWLDGVIDVPAGIPVPITAHLDVFVTPPVDGTARALFDHTAQLLLFMPDGMTFTSQSGEFLADALSPVPEPATMWLLLAGGLVVSSVARRRGGASPLAAG
ncbi:MAG: PEP-CTERM sorting domain-containing protein [Caldimonas sp.]